MTGDGSEASGIAVSACSKPAVRREPQLMLVSLRKIPHIVSAEKAVLGDVYRGNALIS
jgi:hypothetical protein